MGQPNQVRVTNFKVKAISALMVSVWGLPTFALELGRLQLQSAIGEPLRAEVEISKSLPDELRSLRVQLASPESFRRAGMEFNPALRGVTATVKTTANGVSFIALSGREAVQDNFIDLVIESQWATGNLIKNYAVLLNAVNDKGSAASSAAAPAVQLPVLSNSTEINAARTAAASNRLNPSSVELNAQKVPVYRFDPVENRPPAVKSLTPATASSTPTPTSGIGQPSFRADTAPALQAIPRALPGNQDGDTVTVLRGDTASRLAMRYLMPNISLDQMLLAMLKANPDAFIQDNVNLIKAGAVLRMPSADEASKTSQGEARQIVIAQTRDFSEYARRLADSPLVVDSRNTREMTGKVGIDVQNTDGQVPQEDKLTLSKPQIGTDSDEANLALQREKQDNAAKLVSLNQNLKDLQALASKTPDASSAPAATDTPLTLPMSGPTPDASDAGGQSLLLERISQNKDIWLWAAALLALLFVLVFWVRKKSHPKEDVYAPSYNDLPDTGIEPLTEPTAAASSILPQMSSIDLNLNSAPSHSAPVAPPPIHPATAAPAPTHAAPIAPISPSDETENNKLNLAQQLLAKGDLDLARALILSVASSASGDLKSRALQMLGQIR